MRPTLGSPIDIETQHIVVVGHRQMVPLVRLYRTATDDPMNVLVLAANVHDRLDTPASKDQTETAVVQFVAILADEPVVTQVL